ncbi:Cof-type HAD-IIB family hydrolase [Lactobacillus sp. LL6]|uniref:Cof-type HAD-IIB family hydrolase n=1 Tax=Lactobacillus sp. LL6 TaxID=2596827 RepID=UPI0011857AD8|nr:Cof-type HAD-IIB family hydrolase [Lactobacillus sp. LL6]TSO25444.1 HAD family hydrolase [Lactobacillus sp. LL6]
MTLPFKAVAVDMDGTFLDDKREYNHQEFDKILTELENKNISFIVSSGRPYARLKKDFADFYKRMDFVTTNGARILVNDKEAQVTEMKKSDVLKLIDFVYQKYGKLPTVVFERNTAFINSDAPEETKKFLAYFAGNLQELNDWNDLPDDGIIQMTFHYKSKFAKEIEHDFSAKYGNIFSFFASSEWAIDVNAYGVSKGNGLKELLADLDLTGDDLIAFGDSGNDISMLDLAKYSYAMDNGMDEVKKHAKFIAPANTEDGVFQTLREYLTNEK